MDCEQEQLDEVTLREDLGCELDFEHSQSAITYSQFPICKPTDDYHC